MPSVPRQLRLRHPLAETEPVSALLDEVLLRLNQRDVPYALLRHDRPSDLGSDIDIGLLAHPIETIEPILRDLERESQLILVHRLHYEIPHGYYYVLALPRRAGEFLHLDCLFDPLGVNRYYLPTPYLLKGRVIRDGVPCVSREAEALHLLMKRIVKALWSGTDCAKLRDVYDGSSAFREEVQRWFGRRAAGDVGVLLHCSCERTQASLMTRLRRRLWRRRLFHHPFICLRRWHHHLLRAVGRLTRPTGYFVVIVGPDGSGKSTIAAALAEQLGRAFRRLWRFHWRPHVLPRLRPGGTAHASGPEPPPSASQYSGLVSLARFLYYWLDFVIGYWPQIYRRTAQTTLVIGERYYHDVLVNPERYGFAVPRWLLRLAFHWVPSPDLTVLLENKPDVIHRRKSELAPAAIARQITALRQELPHWGPSLIVETTADASATAEAVGFAILRDCGKKIAS